MMLFPNILEAVLGGRELPVNYEDNSLVEEFILTKMRSELSKYSHTQNVQLQSRLTVIYKDHNES